MTGRGCGLRRLCAPRMDGKVGGLRGSPVRIQQINKKQGEFNGP